MNRAIALRSGVMRVTGPVVVVLLSATVASIWLTEPTAADHALFGRFVSALVLAAATVFTIAGAVLARPSTSAGARFGCAAVLAVLAVATIALGFGHFSRSEGAPDIAFGILLWVVAAMLAALAVRLLRVR